MKIALNIGCGLNRIEITKEIKVINIDKSKYSKADKYLDLEKKLPFKTDSIDCIYAIHVLEHIENIIGLMNECYRVLKKKGIMMIEVPQGDGIWADPTHKKAFSKLSFRYYCDYPLSQIYGIKCKFKQTLQEFINNADGGVLRIVLEK